MIIALAGATGFIGQYFMRLLGDEKLRPIALPRRIDEIDLSGVDVVINLVGRAHIVGNDTSDAEQQYDAVNLQYALDLYRLCGRAGVRQFIQMSSIGVLGDATCETPFSHDSHYHPVDLYAASKGKAERRLLEMSESLSTDLCIIRPPLVYGLAAPGNIRRLMNLINMRIPLPFGLVRNRRDFVSIYNLADLVNRCILNPAAKGEIFLASDNDPISTREFIDYLARIRGGHVWNMPFPVFLLKFLGLLVGKSGEINKLVGNLELDISYTMDRLEWRPPYTVEQSINKLAGEAD